MTQSKEDLEQFYQIKDPWGFQTTEDDKRRKSKIISAAKAFAGIGLTFHRALDIGAGEGYISKDLPAEIIHGMELSDNAAARFPENVTRMNVPFGVYDLITATGVLYPQYHWEDMLRIVKRQTSGVFITCNIKEIQIPEIEIDRILEKTARYKEEFPYRTYMEELRVYELDCRA